MQDVTLRVSEALSPLPRGRRNGCNERSEARNEAAGGSLGTNTSFASGAVLDANVLYSQRNRRYRLQVTAGKLARGRVSYCGRRRRRAVSDVTVMKGAHGESYFAGVQRCGSVHSCPVCSARIAQQRRMETIHALASWRAEGGVVSMLTLTLPHMANQRLERVRAALTYCTRYLNSGRQAMSSLLDAYGYQGQIRAAEVTHGGNGWHPHLHVLVLTRQLVPDEVVDTLKARWEASAVALGWAAPDWRVGATWQDGQAAADYVNKQGTWGMAEEVTMSTSKKGGKGGRTPFEILQDAALGCESSALLFEEYAQELNGKKQLFWSRGLKSYFGIGEVSDEEIVDGDVLILAEESTEIAPPEVLAVVVCDSWRLVVRYEQRAEVLRAAECGGQSAVDAVCSWLFERYLKEIQPARAGRGTG